MQSLQLHEPNNEQQLTYPATNMDITVSNQEDEVSKLEKEAPSPTQPKTLQQEFSLINMNIPNIEVC